ncbi:MAG: hypothetical protein U9Q62_06195 [Campylobacterota bacterium]|nr:hypothetical protein [Campylobacterota bacterium]
MNDTSMNEANKISAETKLYGFIAEKAQSNRYSVLLNKLFKANGDDAMIIPMNIREDDLYFTVSGLRNSQLKGAAFGEEYRHDLLDLLEGKSEEVLACGFCDLLHIRDEKLYGEITIGRAIAALLLERGIKVLSILGSGALAKSILMHLKESSVEKVILYNDRIESCMELMQSVEEYIAGIEIDIERVIDGEITDLSQSDAAFNASTLQNGGELSIDSAPLMIDLCTHTSLFKAAATEEYIGYDMVLPYLTQTAYTIWSKQ